MVHLCSKIILRLRTPEIFICTHLQLPWQSLGTIPYRKASRIPTCNQFQHFLRLFQKVRPYFYRDKIFTVVKRSSFSRSTSKEASETDIDIPAFLFSGDKIRSCFFKVLNGFLPFALGIVVDAGFVGGSVQLDEKK